MNTGTPVIDLAEEGGSQSVKAQLRLREMILADDETGLGPVRLNGELDRTVFQLRRFAKMCEDGVPYFWLDDPAVAGGPPAGHPDMGRVRVPLGPVAMFAASNFPFAFSVPGGDTASALAAGCSHADAEKRCAVRVDGRSEERRVGKECLPV